MYGIRFLGNAFVITGIVSGVAAGVIAFLCLFASSIRWPVYAACALLFFLGVLFYCLGGVLIIVQNLSEKAVPDDSNI